jgi:hypothetical protein
MMREPVGMGDVRPLTKEEHLSAMSIAETPFYIDSGATSHCSPICAKFVELHPIEARNVKGMSSLCISAIRRGTIKL